MKKVFVITLILAAVTLAAIISLMPSGASSSRKRPLTAQVKRLTVSRTVRLSGRVKPIREAQIKATVSGVLRSYLVTAGDTVNEGQPLAIIRPDPLLSQNLERYRNAVSDSRIDADRLRREYERVAILHQSGLLTSVSALESARDVLEVASNRARLAERELAVLEDQAQQGSGIANDFRLLSPMNGVVLSTGIQPGETLVAGISAFSQSGTVIAKVADMSRFLVRMDVGEADIMKISVGMPAEIISVGAARTYKGVVSSRSIDGSSSQSITSYPVDILVEAGAELLPGMNCDVNIVVGERPNVLTVPNVAITTRGTSTFVRTLRSDGSEQEVPVTTGLIGDDVTEITSGLKGFEEVLLASLASGGTP